MIYTNIYVRLLKNKKNYNLIFFNIDDKIVLFLNVNYNLMSIKAYNNLYLKIIKSYFIENGFKILLFENWYKFGMKYNLILSLLS